MTALKREGSRKVILTIDLQTAACTKVNTDLFMACWFSLAAFQRADPRPCNNNRGWDLALAVGLKPRFEPLVG